MLASCHLERLQGPSRDFPPRDYNSSHKLTGREPLRENYFFLAGKYFFSIDATTT
jgi:hypothetical protein